MKAGTHGLTSWELWGITYICAILLELLCWKDIAHCARKKGMASALGALGLTELLVYAQVDGSRYTIDFLRESICLWSVIKDLFNDCKFVILTHIFIFDIKYILTQGWPRTPRRNELAILMLNDCAQASEPFGKCRPDSHVLCRQRYDAMQCLDFSSRAMIDTALETPWLWLTVFCSGNVESCKCH